MNISNVILSDAAVDAGSAQIETPAATYRQLFGKGFWPDEAGNVTAYLHGLPPVESGWHPDEIARCSSCATACERCSGDC
jgi:hypothetical protein